MSNTSKICSHCGQEKSINNFYLDKKRNQIQNYCKPCKLKLDGERRRKKSAAKRLEKQIKIFPTPDTQVCKTCNIEKSLNRFYFRKDTHKHKRECYDCENARRNKRTGKIKILKPQPKHGFKFCSTCGLEKLIKDFPIKDKIRGTRRGQCQDCFLAGRKKYREENKATILAKAKIYAAKNAVRIKLYQKQYNKLNKSILASKNKIYREQNKNQIKLTNKIYSDNNKEKIKLKNRLYYLTNKPKILVQNKEYRLKNKSKLTRTQNNSYKLRRQTDPAFRLRTLVSRHISFGLKFSGTSKKGQSILNYLPYTFSELKQHLENQFEPWMTWSNHGKYNAKNWNDNDPSTWTWQIDHIIPQSDLPYASMEEENFKKCWDLTNLRPLSAKQNNYDGVYRIRHQRQK